MTTPLIMTSIKVTFYSYSNITDILVRTYFKTAFNEFLHKYFMALPQPQSKYFRNVKGVLVVRKGNIVREDQESKF